MQWNLEHMALTHYYIKKTMSPFWAFAIHDGQHIAPEVKPFQKLTDEERLHEEDPFTAAFAEIPINQFIVGTSRFQLDLNRDLENAIYLRPDQAWGLDVWYDDLPASLIHQLQNEYKRIYTEIEAAIQETIDRNGFFVAYDIHSYNAKREGPDAKIDEQKNPEINLGTASINAKWQPLIQDLMAHFRSEELYGKPIDIRENVKFKGGHLSRHLNQKFGEHGCVLAFEFRKDFMDEWKGIPNLDNVLSGKQLLMNSLTALKTYFPL